MLNSKKRLFLFSLLLIVLFLPLADFSSAAPVRGFEIKYPSLPGTDFPNNPILPEYIKYIFSFSIWIAGLIAFGALVYGGVRYLTSVGSPSAQKEGRDQISAGILGLALLLGSILLLNTINPKIVAVSNPIKTVDWGGIVIFDGGGCTGASAKLSISSADTQSDFGIIPWSFKFTNEVPRDALMVFGFPRVNYEPQEDVVGIYISLGGESCHNFSAQARSVLLFWKVPGVILTDSDARPAQELLVNKTLSSLTDFSNKTDAIKFNNLEGLKFGAILHDYENQKGECSVFVKDAANLDDYIIKKNRASSITTFLQSTEPLVPGQAVRFYENEDDSGSSLTMFPDTDARCTPLPESWNDRISSLTVDRGLIVAMFEHIDCSGICQVFTQSDANLRNDPIGRCGCGAFSWNCQDCASAVIVLPTGK